MNTITKATLIGGTGASVIAVAVLLSSQPQEQTHKYIFDADTVEVTVKMKPRRVDTVVVEVPIPTPEPEPPASGVAYGPWHLPPSHLVNTFYSGAYLAFGSAAGSQDAFLLLLEQAKNRGLRVMVNLVPRVKASGGGPDMAYYYRTLALWRPFASKLAGYGADGTIIGFMLGDEPMCGSCWGGKTWTVSQFQGAADSTKALVPSIPRGFRETGAKLKALNAPNLYPVLDFAWLQYEGPLHLPCAKAIQTCIDQAATDAGSIGLRLVGGTNTLDGGDGSSGIPGTYNLTTVKTRWQLSQQEVLNYGLALVNDQRVCAVVSWRYGADATKNQINSGMTDKQLADIRSFDARMASALDSVARVAYRKQARSCAR